MAPQKLIQINAASIAFAFLLAIPGQPAWAAIAGTVRSGATAGAASGSAGAVRLAMPMPRLAASALPATVTAPSASLLSTRPDASVAPAAAPVFRFAAPASAPVPASVTPAAAVIPAAQAAPAPPAGSAAQAALAAAEQIRTLDPAAFQAETQRAGSDRWAARAVALFDGMLERPRALAVSAPEGGASPAPGLGRSDSRFPGPHVPVMLVLHLPESQADYDALMSRLVEENGFRRETAVPVVRSPRAVFMQGYLPAERLEAVAGLKGVASIAASRAPSVAPYERPVVESQFRAFVRRAAERSPMSGMLTTMPLQAFAVPALLLPLFVGMMIGGAPGASLLQPVLIGGGVALLGTFSFLAPLARWIPAPLRAAIAYGAVVLGGSALVFNGMGLAGVWLAANGLLGMAAAGKTLARLATAPNDHLADKIVNGADAALHVNLIGYQLLMVAFASLMGAGLLVAVLSLMTGLTLVSLGDTAPSAAGPAAPQTPGPDGPAGEPRMNLQSGAATPSAKPARQPFVAASRKVAELEKLVASDPDAALALASDYLLNETDRRHEVRIGALRALEAMPLAKALPVYQAFLDSAAKTGVQLSKQTAHDKWWYYQWEILRRIAGDSASIAPGSDELLATVRASYKDWNASVRLMSAQTLLGLGHEPGPEPEHVIAVPQTTTQAGSNNGDGTPRQASPESSKRWKWILVSGLAVLLGVSLFGGVLNPRPVPTDPPAAVQTVESPAATASNASPAASPSAAPVRTTPQTPQELTIQELDRIADAAERSAQAAEEQNARAVAAQRRSGGSWMWTLFLVFAPIVLMVWLFTRMARGGGGGINNMAKAQSNLEKPTVRFHDVAGIDESMVEVEEIVDYLRNPHQYARLGARVPKGVLLEGPPGSGKTLLAKALAGETDANFISMSGSDFVQMYVGVGAARVRDLFEQAKKSRPAVIFIDEIDAVGKARGSGGPMGDNDEREQTINAMLSAMDGFTDSTGIIVVAATNRADTLDPALTRPGRFDRKIHVGAPEVMGREAILALHARKIRLAPDADLRYIARRTAGLTGAFLENVVIEAARLAARRGADMVTMADLDEGVDRATIGPKRSLKLSDELKLRIARHESGHVLANLLNEKPELRQPTNKVTIVPHGTGALGFAEMGSPEGDTYLYTKSQLEARLDHAMGGLVAERMYYGEWSTGPGSDLQQATRIARVMVQQLGMDEKLGFPQTDADRNDPFGRQPFGEAVGGQVHEATKRIIQQSYERVLTRLEANRDRLDAMSAALMDKETLIDTEIAQYAFGELPKPQAGTPKN